MAAGHTIYPDHFRFLSEVSSPSKLNEVEAIRKEAARQFRRSAQVKDRIGLDSPARFKIERVKKEGNRIQRMQANGISQAAINRRRARKGIVGYSSVSVHSPQVYANHIAYLCS